MVGQVVQTLWKAIWPFPEKLNINLTYVSEIPLQGIYPREMKRDVYTKTCMQMFIGAPFITARV